MVIERSTYYFEKPGSENTDMLLEAVKARIAELNLRNMVVASTTGMTGFKVAERFNDLKEDLNVVIVTHAGASEYTKEDREKLQASWVKMLTCPHVFSWGIGDAFRGKYQGYSPDRVAAEALKRFSEGLKVAVEITMMATDAGLIPEGEDVIAVAGTGRGADTAIILRSAHTRNFLTMKIREIVAMPR